MFFFFIAELLIFHVADRQKLWQKEKIRMLLLNALISITVLPTGMFLTKKLKLEFYESEQNLFLIYPAFLAPRFFCLNRLTF